MGLHLCYELSLPGETSSADVAAHVAQLHARALTLPFEGVSSIVNRHDDDPEMGERPRGFTYRELEDVVASGARGVRDGLYRRAIGIDPEDPRFIRAPDGTLIDVIAFAVAPGRGSEPATFGFARLVNLDGPPMDWWWHECCKTQYASIVSDDHLVRCHTSLVTLLDAARDIGIQLEVRDQAGYWDSRDPRQLVEAVREMNQIIARIAGKFTDALRDSDAGRQGFTTGGAIFDHPDFERLETEE